MKIYNYFYLIIILLITNSCGVAGWSGYYKMENPAIYSKKMDFNVSNNADIKSLKAGYGLSLPSGCSGYAIIGVITPITPPIPLLFPRSFSWGDNDCNYFQINTNIPNSELTLLVDKKIYKPSKSYELNNKATLTFPIKAKNIDSGTVIIKTDDKIIKVPFRYKYFGYWH